MKSHSKLLWLWLPILVILIVTIGANLWNYFFFLYPPKETESTFLKNYTPNSVIEKFEVETASSYSRFSSGRPGRKFVTHTGGFGWHFAMQSKNWMPFMNALRDDASAQLVVNRAQILSQSGDPRTGFHFEYKLGNRLGALTISPLQADSLIHRATPLGRGLLDVRAKIEQTETWFPKEPSTISLSVDSKLR